MDPAYQQVPSEPDQDKELYREQYSPYSCVQELRYEKNIVRDFNQHVINTHLDKNSGSQYKSKESRKNSTVKHLFNDNHQQQPSDHRLRSNQNHYQNTHNFIDLISKQNNGLQQKSIGVKRKSSVYNANASTGTAQGHGSGGQNPSQSTTTHQHSSQLYIFQANQQQVRVDHQGNGGRAKSRQKKVSSIDSKSNCKRILDQELLASSKDIAILSKLNERQKRDEDRGGGGLQFHDTPQKKYGQGVKSRNVVVSNQASFKMPQGGLVTFSGSQNKAEELSLKPSAGSKKNQALNLSHQIGHADDHYPKSKQGLAITRKSHNKSKQAGPVSGHTIHHLPPMVNKNKMVDKQPRNKEQSLEGNTGKQSKLESEKYYNLNLNNHKFVQNQSQMNNHNQVYIQQQKAKGADKRTENVIQPLGNKKVELLEYDQLKSKGSISPFGAESYDEHYLNRQNQDLRNYNKDLQNILKYKCSHEQILQLNEQVVTHNAENLSQSQSQSQSHQNAKKIVSNMTCPATNIIRKNTPPLSKEGTTHQAAPIPPPAYADRKQTYGSLERVQGSVPGKASDKFESSLTARTTEGGRQKVMTNHSIAPQKGMLLDKKRNTVQEMKGKKPSIKTHQQHQQQPQISETKKFLVTPTKRVADSQMQTTNGKKFFYRSRNTLTNSIKIGSMTNSYYLRKKNSYQINNDDGVCYTDPSKEMSMEQSRVIDTQKNQTASDKLFNVDDFQVLKMLGQGSFGTVQLVRELKTNKLYALKCLNKQGIRGKKHIQHILNERDILKQFRPDDFCCNIFESFQDQQNLYMVLEYLPGGELIKHIRKQVFMSEQDTRFYLAEIVLAIESLHKRGIIYRDLKPENILLDSDGHIKLIDFGFAKKLKNIASDRSYTNCGTPGYCAPEVMLANVGHNYKADMWSIGILMCEMIGGFTPFENTIESKNPKIIMEKCRNGKLNLPKNLLGNARELVRLLLVDDPMSRLDFKDIKNHPFFRSVNWSAIYGRKINPPFVPDSLNMPYLQNEESMQIREEENDEDNRQPGDIQMHNCSNRQIQLQFEQKTSNGPTTFDTLLRPLQQIPEFPNEPSPSTYNTVTQTKSDKQLNPTTAATAALQLSPPEQMVQLDTREANSTVDKIKIMEDGSEENKKQQQGYSFQQPSQSLQQSDQQISAQKASQPAHQNSSSTNLNQTLECNSKKSVSPSFRSSIKYSATGGTGGPNANLQFRKVNASRVLGDYQMSMINKAFEDF